MSITDPIAEMLTVIRNGNKARLGKVEVPASKLKVRVLEILRDEGFVKSFKPGESEKGHSIIKIFLKYDIENKGILNGVSRVSKPGLRRYIGYRDLPKFKGGYGISILTTSRGLMTDQKAREQKVGGEILCSVW